VPCGSIAAYQAASGWSAFTNLQCAPTGVDNVDMSELSIYPNPAKNELFIQSDSPIDKVEIYNLAGSCVLSESNFAGSINVSTLAAGVYFVKIHTATGEAVQKMIKE
jgi:hypothetical protein